MLHATVSLGDWCLVSQDGDVLFHQGLKSPQGMTWTLCPSKISPLCCLKTSGTHHSVTDFHIPEEQKPQMHQCNSVKSHYAFCSLFCKWPFQIHTFIISFPYFSPASLLSPHLSIFLLFCLLIPNMQRFHFIFDFICQFHWISPFTFPSLLSWSLSSDIAPLQSVFHMHPYFYPTSLSWPTLSQYLHYFPRAA